MRLNQVTLPSRDVARFAAFYQSLGFRLIVDSPPHYVRLLAPDGTSTLSGHLTDNCPAAAFPAIYFECDDLDRDCARLAAAGIRFDEMPKDQTWLWREAYLRDPDGNRICLFHAGKNRLDPPWRVKGS